MPRPSIPDTPPGSPPGGRKPLLIPLVVAATFFLQMLDTTILNTSLPQMARSLGVPTLELSLGVTIYLLCSAAFLPLSGWLADRWGTRRVYLAAIALFSLASSGCGLAQENWQFVLARAVQGLGGAMMTPVGRMVVLRSTGKADLLRAMATITWPALTAPLLGPVIGGFVTTYASWRLNFLANLPLGFAAFLLVRRFVPDFRGDRARSFDLKGLILVSSSLMLLLYGLESLPHARDGLVRPAACLAAGLALGAAALRHLRAAPHGVLDLGVFRHPTFAMTTLTAGMLIRVAITSTPFLLPLLFQEALGYRPVDAGLFTLAYFAGNFAMKSVAVPALRRFGFRKVVVGNGLLVGAFLLAIAVLATGNHLVLLAAVLVLAGLARSMQFTSLSSLAFADVEDRDRSSASTLASMSMQIAMALGVSSGVLFLGLSRVVRGGGAAVETGDFRFAFICAAGLAFLSSWFFLRLPKDAGAEITGHRQVVRDSSEAVPRIPKRVPHELEHRA